MITVAEDFAFGYEQMGGFQRVFEDSGGKVVKKLWPPLVTPDYTPYLAQMSGVDAVVSGFAGSNPLKFMRQYKDQGLTLPMLAGSVAMDDALLKSFGDEAIGVISCSGYTADLDTPSNKRFVEDMRRATTAASRASTPPASISTAGGRGGAGEDRRQDRRQGGASSPRCAGSR